MRLISWNVNGLRAVMKKGFTDIFTSEKLMGDMAAILHSFRKP